MLSWPSMAEAAYKVNVFLRQGLGVFNFTILSFRAQNLRKKQGTQAAANRKVEMVL